MKLYIVNGPNLNMLGIREPDIYGRHTYEDLVNELTAYCAEKGVELIFVQSNHEGELVTAIQNAYFEEADGIVINPAAYTHTSVVIADALRACSKVPAIEVHISNISSRESFRHESLTAPACTGMIAGLGVDGYEWALRALLKILKK